MKSLKPRPEVGQPPDGSDQKPPVSLPSPPLSGGRNAEADFRSTTDPEARLYRKGAGREAKLDFLDHALMENRCGLIVDACLPRLDRLGPTATPSVSPPW